MRSLMILITVISFGPLGCSNDPLYVCQNASMFCTTSLESDGSAEARASMVLPIKAESMNDLEERTALATELGLTIDDVPYVRVGDIEVSVEWTIKNLDPKEGEVRILLNGANQMWAYDPTVIPVDDEEPPPPSLDGDIPLHIAGNGTLSGLFKEDQMREASIDLDQITRGNVNPFRATLTINKHADSFAQYAPVTYDMNGEPLEQMATGVVYPREAFAQMVRVDIVFRPDRHMVLEFGVRVRDIRGIMHELLDAAFIEAPGELAYDGAFMPPVFMPPAP